MTKTSQTILVNGIIDGIFTYFRDGKINSEILAKKLINPELERIKDFDKILKMHFILQDKVVEFIDRLNKNIRRIKKKTKNNLEIRRNNIKGRVLWNRTILAKNSKFFGGNTIFYCNNVFMNFNTPENIVLKKFLYIVYSTFLNDLKEFNVGNYNYEWFNRWKGQRDLINEFLNFYQNNIYLKKINVNQNITNRNITKVIQSRNLLYKTAAELLIELEQINNHQFTKNYISNLLTSTLIVPNKISTLFELYCIFKIIFKIQEDLDIKLNIIGKNNKELVFFENEDYVIKIFHDSTGSLNFNETLKEVNHFYAQKIPFLTRFISSRMKYYRILKKILNKKPDFYLYRGRPDIIIEVWKKVSEKRKILEKIYIGEVKYTDKEETFSKGLKELMEYLYFAKLKIMYIISKKNNFQSISKKMKLIGVLIADGTDFITDYNYKSTDFELNIYNSKTIEDFQFGV